MAKDKSGFVNPNKIYQDILNPVLVNLPSLDSVSRQAQILSASSGDDVYDSVTGARHSPKPFIIGFIVPDVPINYLPVAKVKNELAKLSTGESKKVPANPSAPSHTNFVPTSAGTPGLNERKWTSISAADLKDEIAIAFRAVTGKDPTPEQVGFIFAQMALENGKAPGTKNFSVRNYNLGNFHAGGGQIILGNDKPKDSDPLPAPEPKPSGGSYFLTWDTRSRNGKLEYYACYMQNDSDLKSGTQRQVSQLVKLWPGVVDAQTPEQYIDAVTPFPIGKGAPAGTVGFPRHNFHETPKAIYLRSLQIQYAAYQKQFGEESAPAAGPGISASEFTSPDAPPGTSVGAIMDNGDICGADVDPLQTSIGRNIVIDEGRRAVTDAYIQSIRDDIERLRATPPLLMLVNPQTFDRTYEQSVDSGNKSRTGPIVHTWLEKPGTISCKGVTAAQYVLDASGAGGLSSQNRIHSISYQNLLSLIFIYKNNGNIFDGYAEGSIGTLLLGMNLYIYYDGKIYIGGFEDFSFDDVADKPYNMGYSFKFSVKYEVEVPTAAVSDSSITSQFGF